MPELLLKDIGLKDNEVQVYLALLKEGPCKVLHLSRSTGIERSLCYQILNRLSDNGLVSSVIKDNRSYFSANEPAQLKELLRNKENELRVLNERLESKLPKLNALLSKGKSNDFNVEVYVGVEGGKIVRMKVLNESNEYYVMGYHKFMTGFSDVWRNNWHRQRVKRKIKRKVLVSPAFRNARSLSSPLTSARILPFEHDDDSPMTTMIFGNDKVLVSLPTENEYYGILITNKQVHTSYKAYFDMLWKLSEKI